MELYDLTIGFMLGATLVAVCWMSSTLPDERSIGETAEQWYYRKHENFLKGLAKVAKEYRYDMSIVTSTVDEDGKGGRNLNIDFEEQV